MKLQYGLYYLFITSRTFDIYHDEELKHPVTLDLLHNIYIRSIFSTKPDCVLVSAVNSVNAV